jgi:hypothetical protein
MSELHSLSLCPSEAIIKSANAARFDPLAETYPIEILFIYSEARFQEQAGHQVQPPEKYFVKFF